MGEGENGAKRPALRLGSTKRHLDVGVVKTGVRLECPFRPGLFVTVLPGANYNPRYREAVQARAGADEWTIEEPDFVADALVATMEGIADAETGEPVPYTRDLGVAILADEQNADVREWVVAQAHRYARFYAEDVEADAKN